jgi:hypothetical protein
LEAEHSHQQGGFHAQIAKGRQYDPQGKQVPKILPEKWILSAQALQQQAY